MKYQGFKTWQEVMDYAKSGKDLFYKAPLDRYDIRLVNSNDPERYTGHCRMIVNKRTIRIIPPSGYADPFTADRGHLDRISRPIE